jgi:hypothetical protein
LKVTCVQLLQQNKKLVARLHRLEKQSVNTEENARLVKETLLPLQSVTDADTGAMKLTLDGLEFPIDSVDDLVKFETMMANHEKRVYLVSIHK